ncbi:ribosomal protein subunit L20 [Metschnikowia aff. pulcherrima]|uniref:Ribosomal protein subunit L20 n=2 Tax=Metschnikowia TaxID=27320 RepID=A0A4P6XRN6_9ASCO|nr:ribosomal protein subunit L20 [Metschnikowia aff. pulcherrima]
MKAYMKNVSNAMFRTATRRISIKSLPHETQPVNKYNAVRSKFNIKPVPTQGLIYNPPASMPTVKETPRAFLPPNDPRLSVLAEKFKTYTPEELSEMPIIYATKKDNSLTPETVQEIIALRNEDPEKWSIAKLAAKFNVDAKKVNVITGISRKKQLLVLAQLLGQEKEWTEKRRLAREERRKRKQMWLRNEF